MFKLSNHFKYESILMITFNPNHVALKHLSEMCLLIGPLTTNAPCFPSAAV